MTAFTWWNTSKMRPCAWWSYSTFPCFTWIQYSVSWPLCSSHHCWSDETTEFKDEFSNVSPIWLQQTQYTQWTRDVHRLCSDSNTSLCFLRINLPCLFLSSYPCTVHVDVDTETCRWANRILRSGCGSAFYSGNLSCLSLTKISHCS